MLLMPERLSMAAKGFIKIYRDIEDDPVWNDKEPFDKRAAYIDLILMVNNADKDIVVGNQPLTVKRGQKFTSIRHLADRWHWSRNKTLAYLKLLETMKKVHRTKMLNGTLLTLVDYDRTQSQQDTKGTTFESTPMSTPSTTFGIQTRIDKNDIKNDLRNKRISPPAIQDF